MAPTPHCPAVFVTVIDANGGFDASNFNGLYTFSHGEYINNRPTWKVPQIPQDKNIQYRNTHWIINGQNKGILSHQSYNQYPPDSDINAQWSHNIVSGIFHVNIKCVHTFSPITAPTNAPTQPPTNTPTFSPSIAPTEQPTFDPTNDPTTDPSYDPTGDPTYNPTIYPTIQPTYMPTKYPSKSPTDAPTDIPTRSPSISPTDIPSNAPTLAPTLYPTDSPIISISANATHIKMIFLWNISKSMKYNVIKDNKQDISDAIIDVGMKYYNASLEVINVYMFGEGKVLWFHLDIFTLCEYHKPKDINIIDNCQILQKDESTFKWLVFNELIKLNSNLKNIDASLIIDRLPEKSQPYM
eukprot:323928_1